MSEDDAAAGWDGALWDSTVFSRYRGHAAGKTSETLPLLHTRTMGDGAANTAFMDGHVELLEPRQQAAPGAGGVSVK